MTELNIFKKLENIDIKSKNIPFNMLHIAYQDAYGKELLHSKLLAGLLNPCENHGLGYTPIHSFLDIIGAIPSGCDVDEWHDNIERINIEIEKNVNGRSIDIFISWVDKRDEKESKPHAVIIENKLHNATDQPEQLNDYFDGTKNDYKIEKIVYLPFNKTYKSFRNTDSCEEVKKICFDFDAKDIVKWLDYTITKENTRPKDMQDAYRNKFFLQQYKEFFECLINTKFTYMKAIEIIKECSIEDINKLQNLADIVKSDEWCEARFEPLSQKLKTIFGERLEIKNKRYSDGRCYAQFFFRPYDKWIELWLEENEIKLWIVSDLETEAEFVEIAGKKYEIWGKNGYYYYSTDFSFDYPIDNQKLIDTIIPMLEELSKYVP